MSLLAFQALSNTKDLGQVIVKDKFYCEVASTNVRKSKKPLPTTDELRYMQMQGWPPTVKDANCGNNKQNASKHCKSLRLSRSNWKNMTRLKTIGAVSRRRHEHVPTTLTLALFSVIGILSASLWIWLAQFWANGIPNSGPSPKKSISTGCILQNFVQNRPGNKYNSKFCIGVIVVEWARWDDSKNKGHRSSKMLKMSICSSMAYC